MKHKYSILVREVHTQTIEVDAESEEDAILRVVNLEGDEKKLEYSHTLDKNTWTVQQIDRKFNPLQRMFWRDPRDNSRVKEVKVSHYKQNDCDIVIIHLSGSKQLFEVDEHELLYNGDL